MRGRGRTDCGEAPSAIPVRLRLRAIRLLALIAWLPTFLHAALTPDEAKRLDADLTPVGAERAGNADGTIPPWTGGLASPPADWQPAMGYVDPFAKEAPLFRITRANADRYAAQLSPGPAGAARKERRTSGCRCTRRTARRVLPKGGDRYGAARRRRGVRAQRVSACRT